MNDAERKELDRVRLEASIAKGALSQVQEAYATAFAEHKRAQDQLLRSLELAIRDKQQATRAALALQEQLITKVAEDVQSTVDPVVDIEGILAENAELHDTVANLASELATSIAENDKLMDAQSEIKVGDIRIAERS